MNIFVRLRITDLLLLAFFLACSLTGYGQGTCTSAIPLMPGTSQCGDTSDGGDTFDDDICLVNYDGGDDYLFVYTLPLINDGYVMQANLSSTGSRTGIALLDACPIGGMGNCIVSAVGTAGNESFTSPPLVGGTSYYIHISTLPAPQSVPFCLDVIIGPQGCTNPLANNYDPLAIIDDNSCSYPTPSTTCGAFSSAPQDTIDNSLGMTTDSITVNLGINEVITDMDIVLDIEHSSLSDLTISLTSPTGTIVSLLNANCNANQNLNIRFDDDSNPLICATPTTGFFRSPIGLLADFDNELVDGDWVLTVIDNSGGDNGKLKSWCLIPSTITANCLAPTQLNAFNISYTGASLTWLSNNLPTESSWDIEIGNQGFSPTGIPTFSNVNSNPYNVTGLTPQTNYDYYVRADCGLTQSLWAGPFSFRTELSNPTACGLSLTIPDNSCTVNNEFLIDVNNQTGIIGVNTFLEEVRVIISHTWTGDVEMYLIAPDGTSVELSTDNGANGDHFGDPLDATCNSYTAFTMNTCNSIIGATAPFIGAYRPEGNLYDFNGINPNGTWRLKICDDGQSDIGVLEYVDLHFVNSTCSVPNDVTTSNVTAHEVDLEWTVNGTCDTTIIEYGPIGFTPSLDGTSGGGTIVKIACPVNQAYQLSGLQELTDYDIYIRENCGPNTYSNNSCVVSISTDCATDPISIVDNFDALNTCVTNCGNTCAISGTWTNSNEDDFDWIVDAGGTSSSATGPADDLSGGGNYIYIEAGGATCQSTNEAVLNSNCLQINANSGMCHLSFYYHLWGTDIGTLRLDISIDGGVNWSAIWSVAGDQGSSWEKTFVDLSAYDGMVARFRFVSFGATGAKGDMALDEIVFYGTTDLAAPSNVFYADNDMDGFGSPTDSIVSCFANAPAGYLISNTDCDDNNPSINPASDEIPCNLLDENCNGNIDDAILPSPVIPDADICEATSLSLTLSSTAEGNYYWYDHPSSGNILTTGNSLSTPVLNDTTTYYVQDSVTSGSGLRITELDLNFINGIEIQSLGTSDNYTGWFVAVSNDFFNINNANTRVWNLGPMNTDEVDYRTDDFNNNYFGANIFWVLGNYPPITGWAMIIDNTGNVVDAVFWGWPESSIQNMNTLINGYTISGANIPWQGDGINLNACGFGTTINLAGNIENNGASDYTPCGNNSIGNANANLNFATTCQSARVPVTVNVNPIPELNILDSIEVCSSSIIDLSMQGLVDVNNTGATLSYHSAYPPNAANQLPNSIITANFSSSYYVNAITSTGCSDVDSIYIKVFPKPTANIFVSGQTNLCSNSGSTLIATVAGGVPPFTYLWSTGSNANAINVSSNPIPGTIDRYTVIITDTNDCKDTTSIDINTVNGITSATINNISDVVTCGGNDGSITITPVDGTGPYDYAWDGPTTGVTNSIPLGHTITGLEQGTYRVTITDSSPLNCELIIPLIVVNGPVATISNFTSNNVSCFGGNDGSISVAVSGTNPQYLWSNGDTSANINMLPADTYDLTVTDGICTNELLGVIITEPSALTAFVVEANDPSCDGTLDGNIEISVIGGTPPYQIQWNTGDTTSTITGLDEGIYTSIITDANGCGFNLPAVILKAPSAINIILENLEDISCFGNQDGIIEIDVIGGVAPYFYQWSNGALSEDIYNLDPDNYMLTVTDITGCTKTSALIIVKEPDALHLTIDGSTDATCVGIDNGTINTSLTGGLMPHFFNWNNGDNTADISNLAGGEYILTAMDANDCKVSDTVLIQAPQLLNYTIDSLADLTCNNSNDGYIAIASNGGTYPHNYFWNNGMTDSIISSLSQGNYQLTITDDIGCSLQTENIVLTQPDSLSITISSFENISCFGLSDGSIDVLVEGGTAPYIYSWNNGTNNEDLSDVPVGTYKLTIKDANDCVKTSEAITLVSPEEILIQVDTVIDVGCIINTGGAINVSITGGVAPYSYQWNNDAMTEDISNLMAGTYSLTVTDSIGCNSILSSILVDQLSNNVIVGISSVEHISCYNAADGKIEINILNATAPFQYNWSHGSGDSTAIDLLAGEYDLTITDVNGCVGVSDTVEILEPEMLVFEVLAINDANCRSDSVGSIDINVFGGTTPYQYQWDNGDTIQDPTNLIPGDYFVTITDANFCSISPVQAMTVEEQISTVSIINTTVEDVKCKGDSTGAIDIIVDGGSLPYIYEWNNGDTIGDINELIAGNYMVTVTDQNGCTTNSFFPYVVQEPEAALLIDDVSITDIPCHGEATGIIDVTIVGGVFPYHMQWSNGDSGPIADSLTTGLYMLSVTDDIGCILPSQVFQIGQTEEALEVPSENIIVINNDTCFGAIGSISITPIGGTPPYTIDWSNGKEGMSIDSLSGGFYDCIVKDALGCSIDIVDIFVDEPDDQLSLSPVSNAETNGDQDGIATFEITGGVAPYTFLWDDNTNNQVDSIAVNLSSGFYTVTITDAVGCIATTNIFVDRLTDIYEAKLLQKWQLFPNPTAGILHLQLDFIQSVNSEMSLYSVLGEKILSVQEENTAMINDIWNLNDFPAGVYFLELKINGQYQLTKRVILNK